MDANTAYTYLALSGVLTAVLWVPYVIARTGVTGLVGSQTYGDDFPRTQPVLPPWAARSQRAHMNMIETMAAFIPVFLAAMAMTDSPAATATIAQWTMVFFYARVAHAVVYTLGIPFTRTPAFFVSWLSIVMIAVEALG